MKYIVALVVLLLIVRLFKRRPAPDRLDTELFKLPDGSSYPLRWLMQGVLCLGASGSGKTSGTARYFLRAMLSIPSGGIILYSKPSERARTEAIFAEMGRSADLRLFGPEHDLRINAMQAVKGDPQEKTHFLMTINETLKRGESGSGGDDGKFWEQQKERWLLLAITALTYADEEVSGPNIQKFINGVAQKPEDLKDQKWRDGFTSKTMEKGFERLSSVTDPLARQIHKGDLEQVKALFLDEAPKMNDKTRTNIISECQGMLAPMNTGISCALLGGETNFELSETRQGKWFGIDMSPQEWGDSGRFAMTSLKYLFQKEVLAYAATPESIPVFLVADEAHNVFNTFDATYISECREHLGTFFALTQSIHSIFAVMKGKSGEHWAEALMTSFGTKVVHTLGDYKSSKWVADLIGQAYEMDDRYTPKDDVSLYDTLRGVSGVSVSTGTRLQYKLQPEQLMRGLRQGGPPDYVVDGWLIRSGDTFKDGERFQKVTFPQR